jgi:hypothetical protein
MKWSRDSTMGKNVHVRCEVSGYKLIENVSDDDGENTSGEDGKN